MSRWIVVVAMAFLAHDARADDVTQVRLGEHASCALLRSGHVACWGRFPNEDRPHTRAELVPGIEHAVELSLTDAHACVRLGDGSLRCWGWNNFGQLGDGTKKDRDEPIRVTAVEHATAVFAGYRTTCTLDGERVKCFGERGADLVPAAIGAVRALGAPAPYATAALRADGTVVVFGEDVQRALGHPFERVAGVAGATALGGRSCALVRDGHVWCWGYRHMGQRGDGIVDDHLTASAATFQATQVAGLTDAVALSDSALFSCAVRRTGAVVCWGSNRDGQLGNGERSLTPSPRPVPVGGLDNIVAVAAGGNHACALSKTGLVSCWGGNMMGELGNGTQAARSKPTPVLGLPGSPATAPGVPPRDLARQVFQLVASMMRIPTELIRNRFVEECVANELCQVVCKPAIVNMLDQARFSRELATCLPALRARVEPDLDPDQRRELAAIVKELVEHLH